MTNSLDLEHLRTLVAISDCGGFSRAAVSRHISQPALSQHVRLLEKGLGCKLFEKEGRGMRLTGDGERVLGEARHILDTHDAALHRLGLDRPSAIVVGSSEHAADQVLPEMLRALRAAFPSTTTRFEIGRSTQLVESVEKGVVDLAFVLDHDGRGAGAEVGRLPLQWYSAPSWVPPVGDEAWPLVAFEEPCGLRQRALGVLAAAHRRVDVVAQSTTLEGVLAGVRAGLGVACLPSAGTTPAGVVVREDLPSCGTTGMRMLARRGLDLEVERTARDAGVRFFSTRRALHLVRQDERQDATA